MKRLHELLLPWIALLPIGTAAAYTVDLAGYYVARDGQVNIPIGSHGGWANPNFGRLTYLSYDGDHFHSVSTYGHAARAASPNSVDADTNNRIPEVSSLEDPLPLSPGSGPIYGDKLVSTHPDLEYGNLRLRSIDALAGSLSGSDAPILYNSPSGRWTESLAATQIGLQLVSITPGLFVGDTDTPNLFESSNVYPFASGAELDLSLILWVAADLVPGEYTAEFRLIEIGSNGTKDSGRFRIDVAAVPVPAALWLLASGLISLGMCARGRGGLHRSLTAIVASGCQAKGRRVRFSSAPLAPHVTPSIAGCSSGPCTNQTLH